MDNSLIRFIPHSFGGFFLMLLLTGCSINIVLNHSTGETSDLVEAIQTPTNDIKATIPL